MQSLNRNLFLGLTMSLLLHACQGVGQGTRPQGMNWTAIADSSSNALTTQFYNAGGHYFNENNNGSVKFNYWPRAHALDALVDTYVRTKNARLKAQMDDWFVGVPLKNGNTFLNTYYDDMLWNALAMLRAYDATKDKKWLDATQTLWDDIKLGWNDNLGGGIAWQKKQLTYKNTPANGPPSFWPPGSTSICTARQTLTGPKRFMTGKKPTLLTPPRVSYTTVKTARTTAN